MTDNQPQGAIPEEVLERIKEKANELRIEFLKRIGTQDRDGYAYLYGCEDGAKAEYLRRSHVGPTWVKAIDRTPAVGKMVFFRTTGPHVWDLTGDWGNYEANETTGNAFSGKRCAYFLSRYGDGEFIEWLDEAHDESPKIITK